MDLGKPGENRLKTCFYTNKPILIKQLRRRYDEYKKIMAMKVLKDNKGDLFIVSTDKIEQIYLHDAYDEFGQQFGYDNAGDYSIYNSQGAAQDDMREAGAAVFGENFKSLDFEADCTDDNPEITFDNLDDMELSDRHDEIVEFMKNWEKENAIYAECECVNYFDGNNWQSKIINAVEFGAELFNLDEDLENEILNAYENADDWQDFDTGSRSESCGYVFETTRCPSFYAAKATM